MELSNFLASVFGLSIIAVCLSLLVRPKNVKKIFDWVENETALFFTGIVNLVIGISIVLNHNLWVNDWRVIITILGWAILLKGIIRLFMPEMTINILKKMEKNQWISLMLVLAVVLGCVLIYFGFTA